MKIFFDGDVLIFKSVFIIFVLSHYKLNENYFEDAKVRSKEWILLQVMFFFLIIPSLFRIVLPLSLSSIV